MQVISDIPNLRQQLAQWRQQGLRIGFVPTMGNLHSGHLALVAAAKQRANRVVVSIFVNPLQFGAGEDFAIYPRTEQQDIAQLQDTGCDVVFCPSEASLYPQAQRTQVIVEGIADLHCGLSRPGHFAGVATVVCKLFNVVQPDCAFFGEKDFQQLSVIRQMVAQLNFPIAIESVPTVREADGLAMSSRNGYLTAAQRAIAPSLYQALLNVREQIEHGQRDYEKLVAEQSRLLADLGFTVDYLAICDRNTLLPASLEHRELVILVAAKLGNVRLIDNIQSSL